MAPIPVTRTPRFRIGSGAAFVGSVPNTGIMDMKLCTLSTVYFQKSSRYNFRIDAS